MTCARVDLERWRTLALSAAIRTLGDDALTQDAACALQVASTFRDEQGHRRSIDGPLLSAILGTQTETSTSAARTDFTASQALDSGDVSIWRALNDLSGGASRIDAVVLSEPPAAPLVHHRVGTTLEVWTESELAAMHGLYNAGRVFHQPRFCERAIRAALWHMEHMQPDNATNHAWAVHVFVMATELSGDPEGELYAQTLLHNCQVNLGKPDRLSAYLLVDSARQLSSHLREG